MLAPHFNAIIVNVPAWTGLTAFENCADNLKDGEPICTGKARWSDGTTYFTGSVPGLIVEGDDAETGEQPAWDPLSDKLNDEWDFDLYAIVCEYACSS